MRNMFRRCLRQATSLALAGTMLLSCAPFTAAAAGEEDPPQQRRWDFNDTAGFVGTEDDRTQGNVTMITQVSGGKLSVEGQHSGAEAAEIYHVLYKGLNIPVHENTRLTYPIVPQQPDYDYDYDYYSMHTAVDLKFTDGTYLSDPEVEDQNRVLMDPQQPGRGQGHGV